MKILGINALNHDAAITLIEDGEILFAGHSERYSGIKNDSNLNAALFADCYRQDGKKIKIYHINKEQMWGMGTPEDLKIFINKWDYKK
jgi:predicted NodU family carbamoyl transferase